MRHRFIVAAVACGLLLAGAPAAQGRQGTGAADRCAISAEERERLLSLEFRAFDQDMNGGWRRLDYIGCRAVAIELLRAWIARHRPEPQIASLMHFHEFQLLASEGRKDEALAALGRAEEMDAKRGAPASWRAYATATRGFMEQDRPKLEAAIRELEQHAQQQPPPTRFGTLQNLNVARGLHRCFGKPYWEAYVMPPCGDMAEAKRINDERQKWMATQAAKDGAR
jgi:hypothetical protein